MIGDDHALTLGYVARHVPPASRIGIDVAVLDIAQDFLLAHLAERGVLGDFAIFKGGTALRFHPADYPVGAVGGDPRREDCPLDSERDGTGRVRSGLGGDDEPSLRIFDRSGSESGHAEGLGGQPRVGSSVVIRPFAAPIRPRAMALSARGLG